MDYADKKDMMYDDCDIEGFSVLEENIANGSQKIFVTKPTETGDFYSVLEKKIEEQQFMTRRNSELIVVSGEPMLAYDGLKLDEQVRANMLVSYVFGITNIKTILLSYQMSLEAGNVTDVLTDIKNRIEILDIEKNLTNKLSPRVTT